MKIRKNKHLIPLLIISVFGALLLFMGLLNHYFFRTVAYDYGNYNFAFWDYAHFRISPMTSFSGTFLQDHFSFTLFYFVPVYWLLNWLTHSYTLIIIQYACVIAAGSYSYKIIRLKTDNLWLGAGVLIYYFVILGRYTTFLADVNLAIISSCFIPVFIYYFKIKKYIVSFIVLVLALFSRENIPLWFIFIFIVLMIDHRKDKKAVIYSGIGITISIIYFILLFKVFIPSIETADKQYSLFRYSALGESPGDALLFMLNHPIESIKLFFVNHLDNPANDFVKAEFYLVYLISGGFILLTRPKYLIWFIPVVAQKVLNDSYVRWGIGTYYSIEVVTLLPLSVFLAISSFKSSKLQKILAVIVCILTLSTTIYMLDKKNNQVPWLLDYSKIKIYDKSFFEAPFNVKAVNRLLKQIPADAKVSASNKILPHLAQRKSIYYFPNVSDAEYIVFSVYENNYLFSQEKNDKFRYKYLSSPEWEVVGTEFPVFLLKHVNPTSFKGIPENSMRVKSDTLICGFDYLDDLSDCTFLSEKEKNETKNYLSEENALNGKYSFKLTPQNKYGTKIKIRNIEPTNYIQISAWGLCENEKDVHFVVNSSDGYNFHSNETDSINSLGWKRFTISFWIPQKQDLGEYLMFIWNSGNTPVYIDDMKIIINESAEL